MATRWTWPPDRRRPRLAHLRVVAERQPLDELGASAISRRPTHALGVRLRHRRARCCGRLCRRTGGRPGERTRSAIAARDDRVSRDRHRRTGFVPRSGSPGRSGTCTSVVLPAPLRPTIATVFPRIRLDRDLVEDRVCVWPPYANRSFRGSRRGRRASGPAVAASGPAPCSGSCSRMSSSLSSSTVAYWS